MNDENGEIGRLKALNASLLRKLKGVRAARKRDAVNYEENLTHVKNSFDFIFDTFCGKKQKNKLDYQTFMICGLQSYFIENDLLTYEQWENAISRVNGNYNDLFGKDE